MSINSICVKTSCAVLQCWAHGWVAVPWGGWTADWVLTGPNNFLTCPNQSPNTSKHILTDPNKGPNQVLTILTANPNTGGKAGVKEPISSPGLVTRRGWRSQSAPEADFSGRELLSRLPSLGSRTDVCSVRIILYLCHENKEFSLVASIRPQHCCKFTTGTDSK